MACLMERRVYGLIILIHGMHNLQWGGKHSNQFIGVLNGVKQGGVLSPIVFAVYIDVM